MQEIIVECEVLEKSSTAGETCQEGGQGLEWFSPPVHAKTKTEELQTDNTIGEGETWWESWHHRCETEETAKQDPGRQKLKSSEGKSVKTFAKYNHLVFSLNCFETCQDKIS